MCVHAHGVACAQRHKAGNARKARLVAKLLVGLTCTMTIHRDAVQKVPAAGSYFECHCDDDDDDDLKLGLD